MTLQPTARVLIRSYLALTLFMYIFLLSPHSKKGPGFDLSFLPQSEDVPIRSTGYSKLPIGVNRSMNSCPVMDWSPVQSQPCLALVVGWDWPKLPRDLKFTCREVPAGNPSLLR